ncbi:hypothetical protein CFIMG_003479RA [Ceratocystis fimbriata CBS 114723]|uniref:Uncharacterized protein n=1 Tax=Ceratocystis fimbriata CBS 114723 TaxID=1035309 RepID=A0A2C5XAG1_9PEZI|nr:hypothetical protein CFIMG_003479RA [Ceratocystis fimbriata CBS 114723]
METSPLVKAHDHARAAARATQAADTTVAINEHTLAAGEFALAANTTSSVEALRTLRLLEDHHKRLAKLLELPVRAHSAQRPTNTTISGSTNPDGSKADGEKNGDCDGKEGVDASTKQTASVNVKATGQIPSLAQPRFPQRNIAESITNNLNSARGIRSKYSGSLVAPSVSNDPASGNLETLPNKESSRSRMQTMLDTEKTASGQPQDHSAAPPAATSEDGYSRFYNAFGSIINRISSPLAFAGLPLVSEDAPARTATPVIIEPANRRRGSSISSRSAAPAKPSRLSESSLADPDLGKIYSKATVRAMQGLPVNESFYVVPPSGHTVSYANILSYADKEKRRLTASASQYSSASATAPSDETDADFVDAGEGLPGMSKKRAVRQGQSDHELRRAADELRRQNEGLQDVVNTLQKRLRVFEASAQSLTESRIMGPKSPNNMSNSGLRVPPPLVSPTGLLGDDALKRENKELEQKLSEALQRLEVVERDNEKMQKKLRKYKEQWDALKESAKARRTPKIGTDDESMASRIV